jgi:alpha-L-rhamnosidase
MLSLGFKTLSETWDGVGTSMNHCMFGHIQEWFFTHVLGIRQAAGTVGFARPMLAPVVVGDLTEASGHHDSVRGRISSAWRREGGRVTWDIEVPVEADDATIFALAEAEENVARTIAGKPIRKRIHVKGRVVNLVV